ncbi:MAG: LCCL domain-containing protein, partial [Solirubrobacteraceae bacterium]
DVYTDDSSVCTAAVHGGLITLKKGGKVTVEIADGQKSYAASKRNGIKTLAYPAWPGSFIVVDAPDGPDTPDGVATGDVRVNGQPFTSGPVRYGSTVDVTRGTLTLTAAGVGSILTFGDGADLAAFKLNKIVDKVGKKKRTTAELALSGGDFSGCSPGAARAAGGPAGKVVRSLWSSGKGHFRTKGKYATAQIRGTKWQTTDQCDGTLTTVTEGAVTVRDLRLKKSVPVKAGGSYLAQAP